MGLDLATLVRLQGTLVEYANLIALYFVFQRRHLGGQVPPTIEVHNPRLNSTVTIDIPYRLQIDNQELYAVFTRDNIVELCMNSLRSVPDWFALVEKELTEQGKRLELCWRRDAHLDWLWLDEDVYGKTRPWAILAGLAVKQVC